MLDKVNKDIVSFLFRANLPNQQAQQVQATQGAPQASDLSKVTATRQDAAPGNAPQQRLNTNTASQSDAKKEPVKVDRKPGRNDRVEIRDLKTGEVKVVKFKVAEEKIEQGLWEILQLVED